jgi:hypothetical protein
MQELFNISSANGSLAMDSIGCMNGKADSDDSNDFNDMSNYATWICCVLGMKSVCFVCEIFCSICLSGDPLLISSSLLLFAE